MNFCKKQETEESKSPAISFEIFNGVEGMKSVWNDMVNHEGKRQKDNIEDMYA